MPCRQRVWLRRAAAAAQQRGRRQRRRQRPTAPQPPAVPSTHTHSRVGWGSGARVHSSPTAGRAASATAGCLARHPPPVTPAAAPQPRSTAAPLPCACAAARIPAPPPHPHTHTHARAHHEARVAVGRVARLHGLDVLHSHLRARVGVWACGRVGVWACGRVGVWACGRVGVCVWGACWGHVVWCAVRVDGAASRLERVAARAAHTATAARHALARTWLRSAAATRPALTSVLPTPVLAPHTHTAGSASGTAAALAAREWQPASCCRRLLLSPVSVRLAYAPFVDSRRCCCIAAAAYCASNSRPCHPLLLLLLAVTPQPGRPVGADSSSRRHAIVMIGCHHSNLRRAWLDWEAVGGVGAPRSARRSLLIQSLPTPPHAAVPPQKTYRLDYVSVCDRLCASRLQRQRVTVTFGGGACCSAWHDVPACAAVLHGALVDSWAIGWSASVCVVGAHLAGVAAGAPPYSTHSTADACVDTHTRAHARERD
jgi:hypothetical protein